MLIILPPSESKRPPADHGRAVDLDGLSFPALAPTRARIAKLFPEEKYGFLETPDGREIYFHSNSVLQPGFDHLEVGAEVHFAEERGEQGPQASTVSFLGK